MNADDSTRNAIKQLSLLDYIPGTITVPLTQGQYTIINQEDADLAEIRWCAQFRYKFYVTRTVTLVSGQKKNVHLHQIVLERKLGRSLEKGEVCDHINGDTLDNRRENLRLATYAENTWNRKRGRQNKSGYKGVAYRKASKKWIAFITVDGKQQHLGYFPSAQEAHEAYRAAAIKHFGEFARFE